MVAGKMAARSPAKVTSLSLCNTYAGAFHSGWRIPISILGSLWLIICALTLCFQRNAATSDLNEAWIKFGPPGWCLDKNKWRETKMRLACITLPDKDAGILSLVYQWLLRRVGDVSFALAILGHHLSRNDISKIRNIKILRVVVSTDDWLVPPHHSATLGRLLDCDVIELDEFGHLVQLVAPMTLNTLLVRMLVVGGTTYI
jgi:pimeloyl-ACP methyl ester carboxylesterase